jgi:hypothetical protein
MNVLGVVYVICILAKVQVLLLLFEGDEVMKMIEKRMRAHLLCAARLSELLRRF